MKKIELNIEALGSSATQSHSYTVVLSEAKGPRSLPIIIGGFEAQAIVVALESLNPSRPLTHDLFVNFLAHYNIILNEIIICNYEKEIFYAKLICESEGKILEIDSRPSDAIALAVRVNCPIYTYEHILEDAGLEMKLPKIDIQPEAEEEDEIEDNIGSPLDAPELDLKSKSLEELNDLLNKVLDKEDYTTAIMIRDEINKRK